MNKELKELLNTNEGELKLNSYFTLRHYTKNILNENVDVLVIRSSIQGCYFEHVIESRDVTVIKQEISNSMTECLNKINQKIVKDFKNGYLLGSVKEAE